MGGGGRRPEFGVAASTRVSCANNVSAVAPLIQLEDVGILAANLSSAELRPCAEVRDLMTSERVCDGQC